MGSRFGEVKEFQNLNPLPPSDAVRKQKKICKRIFLVQYVLSKLKQISPLWNREI